MSTPSEGPGAGTLETLARLGDFIDKLNQPDIAQDLAAYQGMSPEQRQFTLDLARQTENYTDRQRANVLRGVDKMANPLRDKVTDAVRGAVARVHLTYDNTQTRISEAAKSLAVQARGYRDLTVAGVTRAYEDTRGAVVDRAREARGAVERGVGEVRTRAEEFGQEVSGAYNRGVDRVEKAGKQVAGAYGEAREHVVNAGRQAQIAVDQAWEAGADRLNKAGTQIADGAKGARDAVVDGAREARDAVVGGARQARDAVREAPGKVGRWFEAKFDQAMLKAESTLASANVGRHDPSLQSGAVGPKDRAEMAQVFSEALSASSLNESNRIIQNYAQASQAKVDAHNAARLAGGVAPAGQAVTTAPAQPQATGQGEQSKPDLTKSSNGKDGIGSR